MFIQEQTKLNMFRWRYNLSFYYKAALAFAFAGLTGIGAQVSFYLPFTPVPVTLQVLPVLLSGVLLGKNYGALSQVIYASLGALGLAWFAGHSSGLEVLMGATGGYIMAFVLAAWLIGYFTDSYSGARSRVSQGVLMLAGIVVIYTLGAAQLSVVAGMSAKGAVLKGVAPFIPGDIFKALIAISVSSLVLPKDSYGEEKGNFSPRLLGLSILGAGATIAFFWISLAKITALESGALASSVALYTLALVFFGWGMVRGLRS